MPNVVSNILLNINAQQVGQATAQLQTMSGAANLATGFVTGMATALATISVAELSSVVKSTLEFGDNLQETSARLGTTAEGLQRLQGLAFAMNTDVKSLTASFESSKEQIGLYELGNAKAAKSMGILGTEVKEAIKTGKDSVEIFLLQVKALSDIEDPAIRAAAAMKNKLGQGALDAATAMRDGKVSMDDLRKSMEDSIVITNKEADEASNLNDQWDAMVHTLDNSMKSALLNFITHLTGVDTAVDQSRGKVVQFASEVGEAIRKDLQFLGLMEVNDTEKVNKVYERATEASQKLAKERSTLSAQEVSRLEDEVAAGTKYINNYNKVADAAKNADKAIKQMNRPEGSTDLGGNGSGHTKKPHTTKPKIDHTYEQAEKELKQWVLENERADAQIYTDKKKTLAASERAEVDAIKQKLADFKGSVNQHKQAQELAEQQIAAVHKKYVKEAQKVDDDEKKVKLANLQKITDETKRFEDKTFQIRSQTHAKTLKDVQKEYLREIQETKKWERDQLALVKGEKEQEIAIRQAANDRILALEQKSNADQKAVVSQTWADIGNTIGVSADGIASSMANMATSSNQSWGDMAAGIAQAAEQMIIKMILVEVMSLIIDAIPGGAGFMEALDAFGKGSAALRSVQTGVRVGQAAQTGNQLNSAVRQSASGDVFDNGIVTQPSMFKAGNGMAQIGEAGPEVVMPAERMSGGGYGVRVKTENSGTSSSGGIKIGNLNVHVQSHPNSTPGEQAKQISDEVAKSLRHVIAGEISHQQKPGNLLNKTNNVKVFG